MQFVEKKLSSDRYEGICYSCREDWKILTWCATARCVTITLDDTPPSPLKEKK